jgi:hypothetical protein
MSVSCYYGALRRTTTVVATRNLGGTGKCFLMQPGNRARRPNADGKEFKPQEFCGKPLGPTDSNGQNERDIAPMQPILAKKHTVVAISKPLRFNHR